MAKTITTRYDVAEHLRTPEEMAAYLEDCFEEANGDAAFIRKWTPFFVTRVFLPSHNYIQSDRRH